MKRTSTCSYFRPFLELKTFSSRRLASIIRYLSAYLECAGKLQESYHSEWSTIDDSLGSKSSSSSVDSFDLDDLEEDPSVLLQSAGKFLPVINSITFYSQCTVSDPPLVSQQVEWDDWNCSFEDHQNSGRGSDPSPPSQEAGWEDLILLFAGIRKRGSNRPPPPSQQFGWNNWISSVLTRAPQERRTFNSPLRDPPPPQPQPRKEVGWDDWDSSSFSDLHRREVDSSTGSTSDLFSYDGPKPNSIGGIDLDLDSHFGDFVQCRGRFGHVLANTGRVVTISAAGGSVKIRPPRP